MFKIFKDKDSKKLISIITISGIFISLFIALILNFVSVRGFFKDLFNVLAPFVWGCLFAAIALKPAMFFESKLSDKLSAKTKRLIASLIATLIIVLVLAIVVMVVSPKLFDSIASLSNMIANFASNPDAWFKKIQNSFHLSNNTVNSIYSFSNDLIQSLWKFLQGFIPNILTATVETLSGLVNFILGFIICLYLLNDRNKIAISLKKISLVFLDNDKYRKGRSILYLAIEKFTNFFSGKILDSLIIGIICFIAMLFINKEYAILISVVVGVTNIVPFFGPFIGAIPSALILLLVDPLSTLVFVIMIIILQQIDGNIIGPKILGDSVGLSSLWIIFAILVGGAYFGFFGMLLAVPIFSVIYYVLKEYVDDKYKSINKDAID